MLDATPPLAAGVAAAFPNVAAESIPLPPSPVEDEPPSDQKLAIRTHLEKRKAMAPVRVKNFMDLPIDIKTLIVQNVSRLRAASVVPPLTCCADNPADRPQEPLPDMQAIARDHGTPAVSQRHARGRLVA